MKELPKILIVDDKPQNLYTLEQLLRKFEIQVFSATSGFDALQLAVEHDFFVAIVDVQMPEMDGYELVELLRGNKSTATLPIIFVSAIYSDEYNHRKGYDAGAVDFISKPFVPEILLSKVRVFLDIYQQRERLQTLVGQLNAANNSLSRYTLQLETNAQVSSRITSILDLDTLLPQVAHLIQAQFGYCFVGIWQLDSAQQVVRLKAASQSEGIEPFDPEFSIPRGSERSIVAHVYETMESYLTQDTQADTVYLAAGNLRDTRSELVLPLLVGTEMLGVLDIQSEYTSAFSEGDVSILSALAGQIAVAIRNAQLYEGLEEKVQERTAELATAYHQLELLNRNKSDFIQVVSHELRTPLTLIKGFSQMLMYVPAIQEDPSYQQYVMGIVNGSKRMHELVNSMLDMVKIDSQTLELAIEKVSLRVIFETLERNLQDALAERKISLTVDPLRALPEIDADPETLSKVFDNLLTNAIKYTPDGGAVTVFGRLLEDNGIPENDEPFIEVVVRDTGIGIAPDLRELIFTKFYRTGAVALHSTGRTKFKGGGPGLGLSIARGIVEAHGGRIWVESPGYDEKSCPGSEFHVLLPVIHNQKSAEQIKKDLVAS